MAQTPSQNLRTEDSRNASAIVDVVVFVSHFAPTYFYEFREAALDQFSSDTRAGLHPWDCFLNSVVGRAGLERAHMRYSDAVGNAGDPVPRIPVPPEILR